MKKFLQKFTVGLFASLLIFSNASAVENISNFTPERPGIPFIEGQSGLSFPSFNNFTNNPNISIGSRFGDERLFLVAKHCSGGESGCKDQNYFNTVPSETTGKTMKEGDVIRFELYFHNNGEDSYDGAAGGSPDAESVDIGIDLNNILGQGGVMRPRGFIKWNKDSHDTIPTSFTENGTEKRIVTDDIQAVFPAGEFGLEPVKDSAWLTVLLSEPNTFYDKAVTEKTELKFDTVVPNNILINATPHFKEDKMWISFDRIPGCFRYSGAAYFDVIVTKKTPPPPPPPVKEPLCTNLDITQVNGDGLHELSGKFGLKDVITADLEIGLQWTSDDANSQFTKADGSLSKGSANSSPTEKIFYKGDSPVNVKLVNVPAGIDISACTKKLVFPETSNFCTELNSTAVPQGFINGKPAFKLDTNFKFKEETPTSTTINYSSPNSTNKFFEQLGVANQKIKEITQKFFVGDTKVDVSENSEIFFTGDGPIEVKLSGISKELANETVCKASLEFPICNKLRVNYQTPKVGTVTIFSAKSLDQNGKLFNGAMTYKVLPGYGQFFKDQPEGIKINEEDQFIECEDCHKLSVKSDLICSEQKSNTISGQDIINVFKGTNILKIPVIKQKIEIVPQKKTIPNMENFLQTIIDLNNGKFTTTPPIKKKFNPLLGLTKAEEEIIDNIKNGSEIITVNPGEKVYFLAEKAGTNVIEISTDCSTNNCNRSFNIIEENFCTELQVSKHHDLIKNTVSEFTAKAQGSSNDSFNSMITYSVDEGFGSFSTEKPRGIPDSNSEIDLIPGTDQTPREPIGGFCQDIRKANSITVKPGTKVYLHALKEGENVVHVETNCADGNCKKDYDILGEPPTIPLFCIAIDTFDDGVQLEKIEISKDFYKLSTKTSYTETVENAKSKFTSNGGVFLKRPTDPLLAGIFDTLLQVDDIEKLEKLFGLDDTTIDDITGEIYFKADPNADINSTLKVVAVDHEASCNEEFKFVAPETPDECTNLNLDPVATNFDRITAPELKITGDFKDHDGNMTVTVKDGKGGIIKFGDKKSEAKKQLVFTKEEIDSATSELLIDYVAENSEDNKITIEAFASNICQDQFTTKIQIECKDLEIVRPDSPWEIDDNDDEQLFKIKVSPSSRAKDFTYVWEVISGDGEWENGDEDDKTHGVLYNRLEDFDDDTKVKVYVQGQESECYDTIRTRSEEEPERKPEIKKYVYPTNNSQKYEDNVLNVGGSTNYITYNIIFTSGSETTSVKLKEDKFKSAGKIGSINISNGGNLIAESMKITVKENDRTSYTIFNGETRDDLKPYAKAYNCSNGTQNRRVCLDDKDFLDAKQDFFNGKDLEFKNIKKGSETKIYIDVKMKNRSNINTAFCEQLTKVSGCGAEFRNVASYKDNKGNIGQDDAKVIILCPFILTRQGGDVFYHDILNTGIDVSQCSEVKGSTGTGITPEKERPGEVPRTGSGDLPQEAKLLELPSHDVCRFSNQADNVEGYNNALKNFSSTICELRADVAEDWKERNINAKIAANVTRISRWGGLNKNTTINSTSDLSQFDNSSSGVFVVENNDLIIGANGTYRIQGKGSIPAAQTYIVKNGNIRIESNIEYGTTNFSKQREIPSAAFIVIDGDIIISSNVTTIDGILMAVDLDQSGNDGQIKAKGQSTKLLKINGSVFGNVYDLFRNRVGAGDPTRNEGSVTIHYDSRLMLNTPPVITEFVDLIPN
ncbi:hypothetical protein JKY72_05355 [Candidatus Gracilibacteria bacterium]|nr:hypothetical protein [Candidatus Gracilibacteria bacterium]